MKGKGLAAAGAVALVMASGVHHHHGHWHLGIPSLDAASASPDVSANVALGQRLAARHYGWTAQNGQFGCLNTLWSGESGWSQTADTRVSGLDPANASVFAYGIPQARPATKMPHSAWPPDLGGQSNARTQILWGLGYIDHTYGSPCAALSFKRASGNQGY